VFAGVFIYVYNKIWGILLYLFILYMGTSLKIMFSSYYGRSIKEFFTINRELTDDEIRKLFELASKNKDIRGYKIDIYINDELVSDEDYVIKSLDFSSILKVLPVEPQTGGENTSNIPQTDTQTDTQTVPQTVTTIEPQTDTQIVPQTAPPTVQVTNNETANSVELPINQLQKSNKDKLKLKMIRPDKTIFELEFEISKENIKKFNIIKNDWVISDMLSNKNDKRVQRLIEVYLNIIKIGDAIYVCGIKDKKDLNDIKSLSGGRKTRNKYNHKKQTKRNKRDKKKTQKKHNKRRNKKTQR